MFVEIVFDGWEHVVLSFHFLELVVDAFSVLVIFVVGVVQRFSGLLSYHLELEIFDG